MQDWFQRGARGTDEGERGGGRTSEAEGTTDWRTGDIHQPRGVTGAHGLCLDVHVGPPTTGKSGAAAGLVG